MTRTKRRILVGVGLLIGLAGAARTAVVVATRLPDPALANRRELLRWVVTRDLTREDRATVEVLARRLDEEFGGDQGFKESDLDGLDETRRKRLVENVLVLLPHWLAYKAAGYSSVVPSQRAEWLDRTIETLTVWSNAGLLNGPACDAREKNQPGGLMRVAEHFYQATERAPVERQKQIAQFVADLRDRWSHQNFWLGRALLGFGHANGPDG